MPDAADGWSWKTITLAAAEQAAGLPAGALPPRSDTARTDLWAAQRMRCPVFSALLTVLVDHPEIVFYEPDWRHWVHHEQPRQSVYVPDSPVLSEPSQTDFGEQLGGRHLPYPLGGGGYIERYASTLSQRVAPPSSPAAIKADVIHATLGDAVLADVREDYDKCVSWQKAPSPSRRLNPGPADMPVVRSFEQILALLCWTPEVLCTLNELHHEATRRLAEETAALTHARDVALRQELARGEVLALF